MRYRYCPNCATPLETKITEHTERLACSAPGCGFVHWDNPLPVVAALVAHESQFILARNAKWPRRIFSVVTGFLEKQESPEQAALREVKEELNLDGVVSGFIGHYPFAAMNQIVLAFAVDATGEIKPNHELAEIKRLSLQQLKTYDFAPLHITTAIVNDWLARY